MIIKSIKEVVEESKTKEAKVVKSREQRQLEASQPPDPNKQYTSSREI